MKQFAPPSPINPAAPGLPPAESPGPPPPPAAEEGKKDGGELGRLGLRGLPPPPPPPTPPKVRLLDFGSSHSIASRMESKRISRWTFRSWKAGSARNFQLLLAQKQKERQRSPCETGCRPVYYCRAKTSASSMIFVSPASSGILLISLSEDLQWPLLIRLWQQAQMG